MSDSTTPKVDGYVRHRKVSGKHHMYCPVRERKVLLGSKQEDGDIAYLTPAGSPVGSNESWKCLDEDMHVAEATEQKIQEVAGKPEGTLEIVEVGEEAYDVVNTATEKAINTSPLTREQAEALTSGSPEEAKSFLASLKDKVLGKEPHDDVPEMDACPNDHEFGKDHDEHEDCDECPLAESCQSTKESEE